MAKLCRFVAVAPLAILSIAACVGDDPVAAGIDVPDAADGGTESSTPTPTPPASAAIAVAPMSLPFPVTAPAGTSATSDVVITNKGTAPAEPLEQAVITGAQAGSFRIVSDECQAKALGIAESCTIGIAFTPLGEGPAAATLSVGTLTVALSGTSSVFLPEASDQAAQSSFNAVHAADATRVHAVGLNGRVMTSTDGTTWTVVSAPAGSTELRAVYASADGHVYVGGKGPFLMVQAPGTTGFATVTLPSSNPMTAIHALWATPSGAQQKDVVALGEGGRWLDFPQGTTPSTTLSVGTGTAVYAVSGAHNPAGGGSTSFCAVGANATTHGYYSAAGSDLMPTVLSPSSRTFKAVWTDGTSVVAGASDGTIHRGASCSSLEVEATFAGVSFNGIWGTGSELWSVGSGGAIYHSMTPGSWKKVESGTTADLRAVHGTSASNVYVVGDGVILHKKQ